MNIRTLYFVLPLMGLAAVSSCVVDSDYAINDIKTDVNTDVTLMGDGLEVPIGKTEELHLSDVLKMAGDTSLTEFLKTDDQGRYSITASGNYDMSDVIQKMELEKLLDLDGASFSQNVEYQLGDFSKDQFTIKGQTFEYSLPSFKSFDLDDVKIPSVSSEQNIATELYKFRPEDFDIGARMPKMSQSQNLFKVKDIDDKLPSVPGHETDEISIQSVLDVLGFSSSTFTGMQEDVNASIGLGEKASSISDVDNFKIQSGGKVVIALSLANCPLTNGTITPNIKANLSNMVLLAGASQDGDIDLSSLVLTENNGWANKKTYTISGLADGFPAKKGNDISISGSIDIKSGTFDISGARSTKEKISSMKTETVVVHAEVTLNDVILASMDITLGNDVKYDVDPVSMPLDFSFDLPEEISGVDKVILDEAKPMLLEISADNLSGVKADNGHLSVSPDVEITFPAGLELEMDGKAVTDRKVSVTGDLYNGKISKLIYIKSLVPTCEDGQIKFSGSVNAKISAQASGKFSTGNLPTSAASDVIVKGKINCEPGISDFYARLDLDKVGQEFSEKEEFSFEIKGMGDFGEFEIYPKSACTARLQLDIPELTELNIVGKNVVVGLPEMLVVDGSGIKGFNPSDNTITINGEIPELIELPLKYLKVKPTVESGGTTKVTGYFTVDGVITVDNAEVTNITLKEMSSKKSSLSMTLPTVEAGSISLSGDFNKSLDYECKDVVFLDKTTVGKLPKEVKALNDVSFKSVNAIVEITLIGLPALNDGKYFHLVNTSVDLPEFLTAHDGGSTIEFDKDILVENNKAVITKAVMGGIRDVVLDGISELKGDIILHSTLFSEKPDVDLKTLESKISGTVKVALGDGTGILDPGKIAIDKAQVSVEYDVNEESEIKIGNIPEELQGDDVNLGLNPEITIDLKTNFGAPLVGNFTFVPYIKGVAQTDCVVVVPDINLPVSEDAADTLTTTYIVSASASSSKQGVVPVVCDLSPLVKRIPDEIKLYVNAGIDPEQRCVIYPSATYVCKMDYAFTIPMCFNNGLNLNLTSLVDVDSSIGDYLKMSKIGLNMDIVNILPVGVSCNVTLIDDKGAEVALKTPVTLDIKPGDGNTPTVQSFHPEIELADKKTAQVVKKINLDFSVGATDGVAVSKDQYLQVINLSAKLPEGLTFNIESE